MTSTLILDLEPKQIEKTLEEWGQSRFRARQIINWIYQKKANDFSRFSNLPSGLREQLASNFTLRSFTLENKEVSALDGTIRYTFRTHDRFVVSSVFLPQKDRNSVCISTQIGCPVGCYFCSSGQVQFSRNLSRGEILEQILQIENDTGKDVTGILLMGMGEPLLNYDNVVSALRAMTDEEELFIGRRHIIVSTVGYIPKIQKLSGEGIGIRLALSLHAPDDETRWRFIPRKKVPYPVREILKAGLDYSRQNSVRLTIEYIMISGMNDTLQAAQKLVKLIREFSSRRDEIQINLIPYNIAAGKEWPFPAMDTVQQFRDYLAQYDILATVRQARGADIGAACGQLGY